MTIALTGAGVQGSNWTPAKLLYDRDVKLWTPASASQCATGGARSFVAASLQYASVADNATHSTGAVPFWNAAWVYRASNAQMAPFTKFTTVGVVYEWSLRYVLATTRYQYLVGYSGGAVAVPADTFGAPPQNMWNFVFGWYDPIAQTINIAINGGASDSAAFAATPLDAAGVVNIGRFEDGSEYWNGRLSRVCMGKPPGAIASVIAAIQTRLYNSGNGLNFADLTAAEKTAWGLTAGNGCWYPLNETAATANFIDQVAAVNLTQSASPGVADGPAAMVAIDSSGNAKTGRLSGFDADQSWTTDVPAAIGSGYALQCDGTDDELVCGSVGNITAIELYIKCLADNQEILTLQDSQATAVTVAAGVLTFGGSLTGSAILVDGVSKNAAEAGVLLNDNTWHKLAFSLTSVAGSDFRIGTDSVGYGNIVIDEVKLNAGSLTYWKFDDGPQALTIVDGDPILALESYEGDRYQFLQPTAAARPAWYLAPTGFNGYPAKQFNGTNSCLIYTGNLFTQDTVLLSPVVRPTSVTGVQGIIVSSNNAWDDEFWGLFLNGTKLEFRQQDHSGTLNQLTGDTTLAINTTYIFTLASDGLTNGIRLWVNDTLQTLTVASGANNGKVGGTASRDNVVIGARVGATTGSWGAFYMPDDLLYTLSPTANDISRTRRYLNKRYQVY